MECGGGSLICLLQENKDVVGLLIDNLGGRISSAWRDHGQVIVGLIGASIGFWRWWIYRERVLHKRLEEYLAESDKRLLQSQNSILEQITRPRAGQSSTLPLFAPTALKSVLREQSWSNSDVALNVFSSAEGQLSEAIKSIDRRLAAAQNAITSLRQQKSTAHILRGAIASAANQDKHRPLSHFQAALQIPGHSKDLVAKELEANELVRLGVFEGAVKAFQDLQESSQSIRDDRERDLLIARAVHQQAIIKQALTPQLPTGRRPSMSAHMLMATSDNNVLDIRARYAPYQGWDLLDQGDIHFFAAFVGWNLSFPVFAPEQLAKARSSYQSILADKPRMFPSQGERRLRKVTEARLKRIELAAGLEGYQDNWFLPALDHPQH